MTRPFVQPRPISRVICRLASRRAPTGMLVTGLLLASLSLVTACQQSDQVPAEERRAIADSLSSLVKNAYDFSRPEPAARLLALYPDSGRVISAAGGQVTSTRAALKTEIEGFWQRVGQNMQGPRFELGSVYVDVITRDAAIMTFTYSIVHKTPAGVPHTVTGAWTTFWRRENDRWRIVQEHLSDAPPADSVRTDMNMQSMPGMSDSAMHRHD